MDKRSITSARNGTLGGRPVSESTLRAQIARDYISKEVEKALKPIVAKAITDAKKGDFRARDWLSNYSWGKPAINLGVDDDGQPVKVMFDSAFENAAT